MNLPEGWPTEEMTQAAYGKIERIDYVSRGEIHRAIKAALAAAPTPPAQDQADWEDVDRLVKTLAYIQGIIERGEGRKMRGDEFIGEFVLNYVKKLERPAQEDEPVAEIVVKNTFGYDVYEAELIGAGVNLPKGTKLYLHPADDKLRKAAEEVILWLDGDYMLSASHVLAKNLRAALEGK